MAELDYAFLADYASAETGKLTVVGASYTHVIALTLPSIHQLSVAGRIRATVDEETVALAITVKAPDNQYNITIGSELRPDGAARPYGNKLGLLFSANLQMPIPSEGLYEVLISIEGEQVRRLAFDVETAPDLAP